MIYAALLAAVLTLDAGDSGVAGQTPIQRCFATMDGAVYHGDPSDRSLMKANVAACESGIAALARIRPGIARGPEKLFLAARILDRAATLSYIGLGDAATALREVKTANLYFRVAAGLPDQAPSYHAAALANAELTGVQLRTLRTDVASAVGPAHRATRAYTAYHKL